MKLFLLLFWMLGLTCNCFIKGQQTAAVKKVKVEPAVKMVQVKK